MENILEIQKKAFLKEGPPSLQQRTDLLKRCVALIETCLLYTSDAADEL